MAYVNMTKDFSSVKMNIPGLKVTKRQVVAILLAACVGLPVFYILQKRLGMDLTTSVLGIMMSGGPVAFVILFKKDGLGMEKHIRYFYEAHFTRNSDRPYRTDNLYGLLLEEEQLKKEVERIVFRGKSEEEIKKIKESGIATEVRIGNKKIMVPLKGPIDPKVKKELEKAVRKAKVKGSIPETAQDTIPYKIPYEDGIFESADGYFTQTIAYEDVNYELLDNDPKNILFERWCSLLNYFEPEIHFQFNYGNMELDQKSYAKNFELKSQDDRFDLVRKEYSDMQVDKFSKGTNNLNKERYLTYGIHATDYKSAKIKLNKISKQIESKLKRLGSKSRLLDGYERLELLFRIFHPATTETLLWNWDMPVRTGLSSKDFIAPDSFSFKSGPELNATRYFRVGDRIGAVSYIQIFASDMEDRIIADMLSLNSNLWITIHADNIPRKEALNIAKNNVINIQAMIQSEQKDAVKSGYDMDLLPPELRTYKDAGDKLYSDLQRKDEKLFNAVITVVQTAKTRKELENNIFELNGILASYQCRLIRLDNRQEQGYMSSLPLGLDNIEVKRTFTTTDMAIFIPFTTKELFSSNYSRMLTLLYANPGTVLSYGRCQTPLLNLIVLRDIAYETFKSEPFWQIEATYQKGFKGTLIDTETGKTYRSVQKEAAESILSSLAGKPGIVLDYQSEEKSQKAPQLLNLAELQTVMGKKYGFPPDKTLTIAQKLYEDYKIMSYPRTDSQFLTNDLFNEIKEHLKVCDFGIFREFIRKIDFESITMDKAYFNNNKVSDHHALIPTINADMESIYAKLPDDERHCFNEVVCRLIAIFLSPYRYESVNIKVQIDEKIFSSSGTTIRELGYKAINKLLSENKKMGIKESSELQILPEMNKGDSVKVDGLSLSEGKTKPPSRYTPGTIIQLMKKYKIGTSATSASIITTLLNRGFINLEKGKYISTSLGRELINIIPDELKSPNLTIQFEENLQKVNSGELSKEQFLQEIDERIMENLKKFQESGNKKKLGSENVPLKCPLCGRDIRRGKTKSGKINWYCTGYAEETPCNFKLWQEISGKKLTEQNAADLLQGKRTAVIQGFVSKSSGNKFSAALRLKEDGSIEFLFPATKSKNRRNGGK